MEEINLQENKESVKLIRNSRGYNWEIKLREELLDENTLKRLETLDEWLKNKYSQVETTESV